MDAKPAFSIAQCIKTERYKLFLSLFLGTAFITLYMSVQYAVKRDILSWNEEYKNKRRKIVGFSANGPQ
jgi:hypothetical protein